MRSRGTPVVTFAVVGGALAWALLLVAVPYAAADGRLGGWRAAVATGTYVVGGLVCHQQPERSFRLAGTQVPVCARCAGLYAAAPLGLLVVTGGRRRRGARWGGSRSGHDSWRIARLTLLVTAVPTGLTWGVEQMGLASPSNTIRALAALPLGFSVAGLVGLALVGAFDGSPGTAAHPARPGQ